MAPFAPTASPELSTAFSACRPRLRRGRHLRMAEEVWRSWWRVVKSFGRPKPSSWRGHTFSAHICATFLGGQKDRRGNYFLSGRIGVAKDCVFLGLACHPCILQDACYAWGGNLLLAVEALARLWGPPEYIPREVEGFTFRGLRRRGCSCHCDKLRWRVRFFCSVACSCQSMVANLFSHPGLTKRYEKFGWWYSNYMFTLQVQSDPVKPGPWPHGVVLL